MFAVVAAIAFSAFTPKFATVYLVYDGTGPENDFANYSQQSTSPGANLTNSTICGLVFQMLMALLHESTVQLALIFLQRTLITSNLLSDRAETSSLEKEGFHNSLEYLFEFPIALFY